MAETAFWDVWILEKAFFFVFLFLSLLWVPLFLAPDHVLEPLGLGMNPKTMFEWCVLDVQVTLFCEVMYTFLNSNDRIVKNDRLTVVSLQVRSNRVNDHLWWLRPNEHYQWSSTVNLVLLHSVTWSDDQKDRNVII